MPSSSVEEVAIPISLRRGHLLLHICLRTHVYRDGDRERKRERENAERVLASSFSTWWPSPPLVKCQVGV